MDHVDRIIAQWSKERPDLDLVPMGTLGRFKRLSIFLAQEMERVFAAHGLNRAGFDVLATLRRSGPPYALSPSELMDWTMVTSGTITNRLDRLEEAGLITRTPNPKDARGFLIALTGKGRTTIEKAIAEHAANQRRLVSALNDREAAQLDRLLRKWLVAFEGGSSESTNLES